MNTHAVLAPFIVWLVGQRDLAEQDRRRCRYHAEGFLTWFDRHPEYGLAPAAANASAVNAYCASLRDAGATPDEVATAHRAVTLLQWYLNTNPNCR